MTRILVYVGMGLALVVLGGCASMNKPPTMESAAVTPAQLQPGESALITVRIRDRHQIVDRVDAVISKAPRMRLPLHDDGTGGDAEAGDGVWTLKVDVPFTAPPGDYVLNITAYRSDGQPIVISKTDEGDVALMTTAQVSISYPPEAQPEAPGAEPAPVAPESPEPAPEAPAPAQEAPPNP